MDTMKELRVGDEIGGGTIGKKTSFEENIIYITCRTIRRDGRKNLYQYRVVLLVENPSTLYKFNGRVFKPKIATFSLFEGVSKNMGVDHKKLLKLARINYNRHFKL